MGMARGVHNSRRRAEGDGNSDGGQLAAPGHTRQHSLHLSADPATDSLGREQARDGGEQVQQVAYFEGDGLTRCACSALTRIAFRRFTRGEHLCHGGNGGGIRQTVENAAQLVDDAGQCETCAVDGVHQLRRRRQLAEG
jgi:hypothetical protein